MPLPAADYERCFAAGTRHVLSHGQVITIRPRRDASLWLPSGKVIAGEPFMFGVTGDPSGFVQRVPPGRYPLVLVTAVFGEDAGDPAAPAVIAAARLVIRDEPVVSWEMAVYEGQDVTELGDTEFFGYPVDGGTGGFVDAESIPALRTDDDDYCDRVTDALDLPADGRITAGTLTDDDGATVAVVFPSGGGDGCYPTWIGRTADGEVAAVLTDFFILPDEEEDGGEPEPPVEPLSHAFGDFAEGHDMRAGQTLRP